ncbi:MAG: xanthine dehydrogenase family protein molybdopterin-binding subunit [Rhodospirillaceae bacterium]|nr:xanthine dehydrogenase family protein molybdopterin-binding subunit [Rhodospirillaceae bacterium]
MQKFGIGQSVKRKEDNELLLGEGTFQDDLNLPGQAHAFFLRSPHAHADIESIDNARASAMPGVVAIYSGADVTADGLGTLPCVMDAFIPLTRPGGIPRYYPPNPLLPEARVRHVGEAVAMVIAETPAQARDAAEAIDVTYRDLPCVVETDRAEAPDAPTIWPEAPGNLSFFWEHGDKSATDEAFDKAERVVSVDLINSRVIVNPIETRGALGSYDEAGGRYTLHTNTQHPFETRAIVAEILHCEESELRILSPIIGGGFGMKHMVHIEQPMVAWAARKIGRPVRWMSERGEGFLSDTQARDHVTHAELALDGEANFTGLRVRTTANLGAYVSNLGPVSPSLLYTRMLACAYRTPAIHAEVRGVLTNTVFTDAYRGAGIPESAYVVERLVDKAGRETGLGAVEIRRRNVILAAQMPYVSPMEITYDSGDFEKNLEDCISFADWFGFPQRRALAHDRGKLRGIGMALYVESTVGDTNESITIQFNDNDSVTLTGGTKSSGQGHGTVFSQFLHETLGVPFEKIIYEEGDTDTLPQGGGSGGSRSTYMIGVAVKMGADKIIEKGKRLAAHLLETSEADIRFSDGNFTVAGTDRSIDVMALAVAARDAAKLPEGMEPGLDESAQSEVEDPTIPNGCHIVEVEVDPDTGALELETYTAVNDFGRVINPQLLEGQIQGGLAQGFGQAIFENCVYDPESGQLLSGSFMDYCLPRADDMPEFFLTNNEHLTEQNSFGLKGCGEAGCIPSVPAVVNAVLDALAVRGVETIDMPLTPERIWRAAQAS